MRHKAFTKKRRAAFLEHLTKSGNVSAAARTAEMNRQYMYDKRAADKEFKAAWDEAEATFLDNAESQLLQDAIKGRTRTETKIETDASGKTIKQTERTLEDYTPENLRFYLLHRHPAYKRPSVVGLRRGEEPDDGQGAVFDRIEFFIVDPAPPK